MCFYLARVPVWGGGISVTTSRRDVGTPCCGRLTTASGYPYSFAHMKWVGRATGVLWPLGNRKWISYSLANKKWLPVLACPHTVVITTSKTQRGTGRMYTPKVPLTHTGLPIPTLLAESKAITTTTR